MKGISYPASPAAIFFGAGIIISSLLNTSLRQGIGFSISETPAIIIATALFIPLIFFRRFSLTSKTLYISLLAINFGFITYGIHNINPVTIFAPNISLSSLEIHGTIENIELPGEEGFSFTVRTDSLGYNGKTKKTEQVFLVKVKKAETADIDSLYRELAPGRSIRFITDMYNRSGAKIPGEFNYYSYLTTKGINGLCYVENPGEIKLTDNHQNLFGTFLLNIRLRIAEVFKEYTNPESTALLKSLLLGDRSDLSQETKSDFITSGVMHVLAISGLHVSFITVIFLFMFGRFGIVTKSILTMLGLILFLFISGMSISVFRAVLMSSVFLIGRIFDRETNIYNSLGIAALILLIADPGSLFDVSFQLSFAAVYSIAFFYPYFENWIDNLRIKSVTIKGILQMTAVSLAAQIGTLPLIVLWFGKLSIISLVANLLVIPMSGIIVGIGILLIPVSAISAYFGMLTGSAADVMIKLLLDIVAYSSSFSFSSVSIAGYNNYSLIIYYFFIFLLFYYLKSFSSLIPKIILTIFIVANIYLFTEIVSTKFFEDGKLNILFVDVGQGDAAIIKFPDSQTALIDGGDIKFRDTGERVLNPLLTYLGIDKIDYGFISHLDSDHFGGFLNLIYHGKADKLVISPPDSSSNTEKKVLRFINRHNVNTGYFSKRIFNTGNGRIYLLNDPSVFEGYKSNERSGLIIVQYGSKKILFTGDIEKYGEEYITGKYSAFLASDILKVPHHGSKTSTSEKFLESVKPRISVISVSANNPFGHPHPLTLSALHRAKSEIYRTDRDGSLLFVTDGKSVSVKEWK